MFKRSRHVYISRLLILGSLLFVFLNALPLIPESFFPIDDKDLVDIPQIATASFTKAIKASFRMGTHIDFYPIRDLSYWVDVHLFEGNIHGDIGTTFRITNFFLFALSAFILVSALTALGCNFLTSAITVSLWVILPNHFEMIWWIAARKDLLALLFSLLSFRFFLSFQKSQSNWAAFLCLLTFGLGLLSKASFSLLPLIGLIGAFFVPKMRTPKTLFVLVFAVLMGFSWIAIQRSFYSTYNDMRFWYPFSYRYRGAIEALGRMVIGIVWAPVNSVDVFNWGNWTERNREYFWPGAMFSFLFCVLFLTSILKKRIHFCLPLASCLALYLPISALFFPHRNFYSVRYFEPPLVALIFTLPFFLTKIQGLGKKGHLLILILGLFLCLQDMYQGRKLTSNLSIFSKSLALDPTNPSLLSMKLQILSDLQSLGQTSLDQEQEMKQLESQLRESCDPLLTAPLSPTGHLCSVFFGLEQKLTKDLLYIRRLSKAFSNYSQLMGAGTKEFYLLKANLLKEFYYPTGNINQLTEKFEKEPFASVREHGRSIVVLAYCLGGQQEIAQRIFQEQIEQALIRRETLEAQITSTITSALKKHLPIQRYQAFNKCLGPNPVLHRGE